MDTRNNDLTHLNESSEQEERIESEKPSSLKRSYPEMEEKIRKKKIRITEGLTDFEPNIDKETIEFKKNLIKFKKALPSQRHSDTLDYWNRSPKLRDWLAGKDIQCVPVITPDKLIEWFTFILSSRNTQLINEIWENNKQLQGLLFGRAVNFKRDGQEITCSVSIEDIISFFQSALASRCSLVINEIWENNKQLQDLSFGRAVNFKRDGQDHVYSLSSSEMISFFESVLAGQCQNIMKKVWKKNKFLYEAILSLEQSDKDDLIKKYLSKGKPIFRQNKIASKIADTNYLKEKINLLSQNNHNSNGAMKPISISEMEFKKIKYKFKSLLSRRNPEKIMKYWNKNEALRPWLRGQAIQGVPVIKPSELIDWFKSSLTSRCGKMQKYFWRDNALLYEAIVNLSQASREILIKKCHSSRTKRAKRFANQVADIDYLKKEINRINPSKITPDAQQNELAAVENRLENPPSDLMPTSMTEQSQSNIDDQNTLMIDMPADVIEWINNTLKLASSTTMFDNEDTALLMDDFSMINSSAVKPSAYSVGSPTLFAPSSNMTADGKSSQPLVEKNVTLRWRK